MSKQFGDRLKELRTENKLSQEELAKIFKTGKASISHYEKNVRLPDANTIADYASYFDVSIDYILGKSNIKNPERKESKEVEEIIKVDPDLFIQMCRSILYVKKHLYSRLGTPNIL